MNREGYTVKDLKFLTTEQLRGLYQKINSELGKNLLGGASIEDENERIGMLNKISGELNQRKRFTGQRSAPDFSL